MIRVISVSLCVKLPRPVSIIGPDAAISHYRGRSVPWHQQQPGRNTLRTTKGGFVGRRRSSPAPAVDSLPVLIDYFGRLYAISKATRTNKIYDLNFINIRTYMKTQQ